MYSRHRASRSELRDETSGNHQTQHRERGTLRHQRGSQVTSHKQCGANTRKQSPRFRLRVTTNDEKTQENERKKRNRKTVTGRGFVLYAEADRIFTPENFLNSRCQIHTPPPCTAIDKAPNTFEERRFKPFAGLPPPYPRFVFRARKASRFDWCVSLSFIIFQNSGLIQLRKRCRFRAFLNAGCFCERGGGWL